MTNRVTSKKIPKQFYVGDREFLRDTRLSADAKNVYQVLSSLAESCDNVYPSYIWLAEEVGYNLLDKDGKIKSERTINKWVSDKIDELLNLEFVKQIRKDRGYDYEVYDYIPNKSHGTKKFPDTEQKSSLTRNKKVPLEKRIKKEEISNNIINNIIDKKENSKSDKSKKLSKEEKVKINLEALEELKTEMLSEPIDEKKFLSNKKSVSQIWDNEKGKASLEDLFDTIEMWIQDNPNKLTENPNMKARFKQFATNKELGWIYPATSQKSNNYQVKSTNQVGAKTNYQPNNYDQYAI